MTIFRNYYLMAIILLLLSSCKKHEGIGGDASIYGKVHVKHTIQHLLNLFQNIPELICMCISYLVMISGMAKE